MAVADASFNTVKLSMSVGLTELRGFERPSTEPELMTTPSITINGSLLAVREEPPRMRMAEPPPGCPVDVATLTPATLPAIMS